MTICLSLFNIPLFAQNTTINGVVLDKASGDPMIGVTVTIEGTTNGTITNYDGEFEIALHDIKNTTLQFSYVGYKTVNLPLKSTSNIRVLMEEDVNMMEEVIVVGYGTQKKESVIGSIASIDNSTLISVPVSNVTQSLAGKLAGVQVVQSSGEVGRDEASIYVRGTPTYVDSRPLIVVDGITRESFAQIDPNEIQSINVLKDASATAVYGVKGANGVIIVTTRRGATSKPQVSLSAQYALTQPMRVPDPLPAYESVSLLNLGSYVSGGNDTYTALDLIKYRTNSSPYLRPNVKWTDVVMKDFSSLQQYNVNISGGNSFVKYFVSGGYLGQNGFYVNDPYTKFTRYNFRSNLDFDITKRLKASFSLGARIEKRDYPSSSTWSSWNIYRGAFSTGGYKLPVYNPDGSLAGPATSAYNLLGTIGEEGVFKENKSVVEMGLNIRYDLDFILKGLSVRGQLAFDNSGSNGEFWGKTYSTKYYNIVRDKNTDSDTEVYTKQGEDSPLSYSWGNSWFDQKVYGELGLEYARTFGGSHNVTALLLANRGLRMISYFIPYADQGLVGRITYDYNKRYFLELNAGYTGSENFAQGLRYQLFPAFAAGWLVSNEKFISETAVSNVLSHLKIRGSIGWVGNDKMGDITKEDYQALRFAYIQRYTNGGGASFGAGDSWFSGIYQENIANVGLTWETGRKMNIGFESGFFNDLIGLNVDLFYERRSDILTDVGPITPDYVGKQFMRANVGIVDNKGFEAELTHRKRIGKDFSYSLKGNFSFARNKVVKKADPEGLLPYQGEEGYAIDVPLMYKSIGVFESYEDIENSPSQMGLAGNTEVKPGDTKYLDFNGDGVIDINDAFRQGYGPVPEIQYGATLSMEYKGIDFSMFFQGAAHANFIKNWEIMWPFSNSENAMREHWRYWTPETSGDHEYIRMYGPYRNNQPAGGSNSITLGSGDYLRLKNVELGYTLPKKWTSKAFMSSARIYLSAHNLFLWSVEPYLDPDNRDIRGGQMPQTRAFNFGLNINF